MDNRSWIWALESAIALARHIRAVLQSLLPHLRAPFGARKWNEAAEARATALLVRVLSPRQRREFARHGYFAVTVAGRGQFVILSSAFFNVLHVETGDCYCAGPRGDVPLPDLLLSQKLVLENDPERFFRVANRRRELVLGLMDDGSLPERVLSAREVPRCSQIKWKDISLIPF